VSTDPLLQVFFEEAAERLADCEAALIELEKAPTDRALLDRIFRCAHTLKSNSAMIGLEEITRYTHALEDLLELLRTGARPVTRAAIDALLTAQDVLRGLVAHAGAGDAPTSAEEAQAVLHSLAAIRALVENEAPPAGSAPATHEVGTTPDPDGPPESTAGQFSALPPAEALDHPRRRATDGEEASIRVRIDRIDRLINLAGELVIAQSLVSQGVADFTPDQLAPLREAVIQMGRHAHELHERIMAIRMVPLKQLCWRMARLVRDLAPAVGKEAVLEFSGEHTELDKIVLEKIADPLTHLVRNALDHGLEPPTERRAAGKPATGVLRLQAYQQGGSVYIEVSDDGRGIDTQRLLAKARERGLIGPDQALTAEEALALIYRPGLSTAERVTEVSGRGVGMDVVKRNLEALGGSITTRTEIGRGTQFRIKLPLTVAVVDGQAVQVADQTYLLPLINILESVRPARGSVHSLPGAAELVVVRGQALPLVRLGRLFNLPVRVKGPCEGLVVIVEHEGRLAAVLVDEVLGQQQVVVKSLEAHFTKVEGISGATILGDGQVALILDVAELTTLAQAAAARGPLPVASAPIAPTLVRRALC
jgi:two-component system chemotaxis sensor kinase CheA